MLCGQSSRLGRHAATGARVPSRPAGEDGLRDSADRTWDSAGVSLGRLLTHSWDFTRLIRGVARPLHGRGLSAWEPN